MTPGGTSPAAGYGGRDEVPSSSRTAAAVKVSVFHNVETDGEGRHVGFSGYRLGHGLVRVFEATVPGGLDPYHVAELMFEAGTRGLRSLSFPERGRVARGHVASIAVPVLCGPPWTRLEHV